MYEKGTVSFLKKIKLCEMDEKIHRGLHYVEGVGETEKKRDGGGGNG